mmetsp:Transcript_9867/g.28989  ORF Transcript_9867/g.28989 Transcript_9867/m.28989 type:complete len:274 (-) Transcript_9867:1641-2462(-)
MTSSWGSCLRASSNSAMACKTLANAACSWRIRRTSPSQTLAGPRRTERPRRRISSRSSRTCAPRSAGRWCRPFGFGSRPGSVSSEAWAPGTALSVPPVPWCAMPLWSFCRARTSRTRPSAPLPASRTAKWTRRWASLPRRAAARTSKAASSHPSASSWGSGRTGSWRRVPSLEVASALAWRRRGMRGMCSLSSTATTVCLWCSTSRGWRPRAPAMGSSFGRHTTAPVATPPPPPRSPRGLHRCGSRRSSTSSTSPWTSREITTSSSASALGPR